MSAAAAELGDAIFLRRRRRTKAPGWMVWAILAAIVLGIAGLIALQPSVTVEGQRNRTINVVLPPPPPPPPPPPAQEKPPEPEKKVIEEPVPQPDTPPPPAPSPSPSNPAVGDNALTAREGPAAGNYGLAGGDGSGRTIGGRPGGGGSIYAGYGQQAYVEVRRAVQADRGLSRGRHDIRLDLVVAEDGTITDVRFVSGEDDASWRAALRRRILSMKLSQRPPAGIPPVRIELTVRPSL